MPLPRKVPPCPRDWAGWRLRERDLAATRDHGMVKSGYDGINNQYVYLIVSTVFRGKKLVQIVFNTVLYSKMFRNQWFILLSIADY